MNMLTRNVHKLKTCLKIITSNYGTVQVERMVPGILDNFDFCEGWSNRNSEILNGLCQNMKIIDDFITEKEEQELIDEIDPQLWRMKYQFDHWDDAIHGFRETEKIDWSSSSKKIIQRIREKAFPTSASHLKQVHILDLAPTGYIKPHIDAVRFCGNTIAGISLVSDCVMRVVHDYHKYLYADVLLRRRSMYIMTNTARYDFTHEVLKGEQSFFKDRKIPRERRISIICRNEP